MFLLYIVAYLDRVNVGFAAMDAAAAGGVANYHDARGGRGIPKPACDGEVARCNR
jgi:hypothetical protein